MKIRLTKDLYNAQIPYLKNKEMSGWYKRLPYYIKTNTTRLTL